MRNRWLIMIFQQRSRLHCHCPYPKSRHSLRGTRRVFPWCVQPNSQTSPLVHDQAHLLGRHVSMPIPKGLLYQAWRGSREGRCRVASLAGCFGEDHCNLEGIPRSQGGEVVKSSSYTNSTCRLRALQQYIAECLFLAPSFKKESFTYCHYLGHAVKYQLMLAPQTHVSIKFMFEIHFIILLHTQ
jgi:hypothetical protein